MILQFVTTTLERAGYRVQAVANAEDAVRTYTAAAGDPFRLVLSDVLMPNVNGVELAKRLLAHDANVRVLFMSGQVPRRVHAARVRSGTIRFVAQAVPSGGIGPRGPRGARPLAPRRAVKLTR